MVTDYEVWSSNNQLKTVLNECFDEQYRDKENLRPDIVCKTHSNKAIVLEFKRPSEKISLQNLIQVMRYRTIIKKSMPNLEVTTYLIGKECSQEILDNKDGQSKAGNFIYSLREILDNADKRIESIIGKPQKMNKILAETIDEGYPSNI